MEEVNIQPSLGDMSLITQSQDSPNKRQGVEFDAHADQTLPTSQRSPNIVATESLPSFLDQYGKEHEGIAKVKGEEVILYTLCDRLLQEGESRDLEEAEEVLRAILVDPHSFLEPPIAGFPDQLRAIGHLKLAQCLFRQYCSPNAPSPQPERRLEVLEAYNAAAAGALRFSPPRKDILDVILIEYQVVLRDTAVNGQVIEDYQPLIKLQKQVLELYEEEMKNIRSPIIEQKSAGLRALSLYNIYCGNVAREVESYFQKKQPSQALEILTKLIEESCAHASSYRDKRGQTLCQLHLLHHLSRVLMEGNRLECAMAIIGPFVSNCIKEMHGFLQAADTDDETPEYRAEPAALYQECMWALVKGLEEVKGELDGPNKSVILDELIEISRRLANLPEDLQSVKALCAPAIHQYGNRAAESLWLKALSQSSYKEAIRIDIDAVKIAYMQRQKFEQTEENSKQIYAFTFPPYIDLLLPDRWPPVECSPDQRPDVVVDILTHLSMSRRALFAKSSEKDDKMTDDEVLVLVREAELGIHLSQQLLNEAAYDTAGHWRNQVGMAHLLKIVALRKAKSSKERIEEIKQVIQEAKEILTKPVDEALEGGVVERRRLRIIHLLDQQFIAGSSEIDEELQRQKRVFAESSEMWKPLFFAYKPDNLQEGMRVYHGMLANIEPHLPQSPSGTAKEYTVHGYLNLAMLLSSALQASGSYEVDDQELMMEATEAWTNATTGLELHFPGFIGWRALVFQFFAQHLIIRQEYKRSIEMATKAVRLRRYIVDVDFAMAFKGEDWKMAQIMLLEALEQLGRSHRAAQQWESAIANVGDFLFIIDDLEGMGVGDRAVKLKRARILAFKSEIMADSGRKVESLGLLNESALIWKAVSQEIRSTNPNIDWREMVQYDETYGSLMLDLLNMCTELGIAIYGDQSRKDMCQEAANALRSASGMQSGGSFERLPYAFNSRVLFKYADAVSRLSSFADLPSTAKPLAESAMCYYLYAILAHKSSLGPLAFCPYSSLIMEMDWTSVDLSLYPETAHVIAADCAKLRVDNLERAVEIGQPESLYERELFEREILVAEKEVELCRFLSEERLKKVKISLRSEESDERNRMVHERLTCKLAVVRYILFVRMGETRESLL